MNTPICDFVRGYVNSRALRLHMPGHKGVRLLGMEELDITEIGGADSLYEASGIIRESEKNASELFGSETFYSAEGSSLCIRAMIYLTALYARSVGRKPLIAAGRNAHRTFLSAAALNDIEVKWLAPRKQDSYLSCVIGAGELKEYLESAQELPAAVYLTSPDYLGNTVDIVALAAVCHAYGVLLLVDNAHGAYLKFLPESRHPIDLGADMCCDSAHKTLPVLTGGAYLHISSDAPEIFVRQAKNALAMFGSTSPSYLILQSLDAANRYLSDGYREKLESFSEKVMQLRVRLSAHGYVMRGDEPIKLTIETKPYGYEGTELMDRLLEYDLVCEFADRDFLVMMLTPETGEEGLKRLENALLNIEMRAPVEQKPPMFHTAKSVTSVREAAFSVSEIIPIERSVGRVLAAATVGCPPAVPIVVCGEVIDAHAVECFRYYGIDTCCVAAEKNK